MAAAHRSSLFIPHQGVPLALCATWCRLTISIQSLRISGSQHLRNEVLMMVQDGLTMLQMYNTLSYQPHLPSIAG